MPHRPTISACTRSAKNDRRTVVAKRVSQRIRDECPKARWKDSYALLGRFDVVDIVEAESSADAERAALIIRAEANATTETLHATPWKEFLAKL